MIQKVVALDDCRTRGLRNHFQFVNVKKLFSEILHWVTYSINVYGYQSNETKFNSISNLYLPSQVDGCFSHSGGGSVPGLKNDQDKWDTSYHRSRIIEVNDIALASFAQLYDEPGTPAVEARLPAIHSQELISVLEKFAEQPKRLGDLKGKYFSTVMFDETYAQRDGTIRRETCFPEKPEQWILSGPHFYVGLPFYKSPQKVCIKHHQYDVIDLTDLPEDYLPRTNYIPACDPAEYQRRTPVVPWQSVDPKDLADIETDDGKTVSVYGPPRPKRKRVTEYFRIGTRKRLSQSGERTLISMIIPKSVSHILTVNSVVLKSQEDFVLLSYTMQSLCFDFIIKSTGMADFTAGSMKLVP